MALPRVLISNVNVLQYVGSRKTFRKAKRRYELVHILR
jgi:hypothetical protein